MKLNFKEKTLAFRLLIWLDRGLNVCTGGSFQECLSTRAYLLAERSESEKSRKRWSKVRDAINYMFWEGHCKDSFNWELGLKKAWIKKYSYL